MMMFKKSTTGVPVATTTAAVATSATSKESKRRRKININTNTTHDHISTICYLIIFSFLGTLVRLALQSLTVYPGAPVATGVLWANFTGCFIMGFLEGSRELFLMSSSSSSSSLVVGDEEVHVVGRDERAVVVVESRDEQREEEQQIQQQPRGNVTHSQAQEESTTTNNATTTTTILPIYIGLTTGLCGSMTSFSSFTRDIFLALTNDLHHAYHPHYSTRHQATTTTTTTHSTTGQNIMSTLAIILLTLSLSMSALQSGTHLSHRFLPPRLRHPNIIPIRKKKKRGLIPILLLITITTATTTYLTILILLLLHPRYRTQTSTLYSLLFSPPGCVARYYLSKHLNPVVVKMFPLGTFTVNMLGTVLLGVAWDLQFLGMPAGIVGCRVWQGLQDGFCGCLTTVSTWVVEIRGLSAGGDGGEDGGNNGRRRNAYVYAGGSVLVGFLALVALMGGVKWSVGFEGRVC